MPRYNFAKVCHPQGLRDELLASDVPVSMVMRDPEDAARTIVDVPEEFHDATELVVLAHDPASHEAEEAGKRKTYDDAVAFLQTYYKTPNAQLTVDQSKHAIKALTVLARTQHQQLGEET